MSRSLGGTSFTTSPPIRISPPVMSSSPAIIRSVVVFPQPEGPTRTTNSLSEMSRSIPRTAGTSSYCLTTLRSVTCAIGASALCRAGRQAGDVVVHEKGVDQQRRRRTKQSGGHDLAPVENIALDKRGHD